MEFVEAPAFEHHLANYLDEDGYWKLQHRLSANPYAGDLMPGTGGFRKVRWADVKRGKRNQRWVADNLLLLPGRSTNMVDDFVRQE